MLSSTAETYNGGIRTENFYCRPRRACTHTHTHTHTHKHTQTLEKWVDRIFSVFFCLLHNILVVARLSAPNQTDPGAHPVSCKMGTGSPFFWMGGNWPWSGVDHSFSYSAEVRERVELYLYPSSTSSWPVLGWILPFISYIITVLLTDSIGSECWPHSNKETKDGNTSMLRIFEGRIIQRFMVLLTIMVHGEEDTIMTFMIWYIC